MNVSAPYQPSVVNQLSYGNKVTVEPSDVGNKLPASGDIESKHTSAKEQLLSKVAKATPAEMDGILSDLAGSGGHLLVMFFNGSLPDINDGELMGRLDRINTDFRLEAKSFSDDKKNIIDSGKSQGKTSKEIIADIIDLYEEQSELFKTGSGWNGEVISANKMNPDGYAKLLELTPSYLNSFA